MSGLDLSSLRDGAISFAGQVVDVAGNYTGEANGGSSAFGKDTIAPVVTISTVPPTSVDANAYIIEGTVT